MGDGGERASELAQPRRAHGIGVGPQEGCRVTGNLCPCLSVRCGPVRGVECAQTHSRLVSLPLGLRSLGWHRTEEKLPPRAWGAVSLCRVLTASVESSSNQGRSEAWW